MEFPLGRLRLTIALARVSDRRNGWEDLAAAGRHDHELARLNQRNTRNYEGAPWIGLRLVYNRGRRP